MLEFKARRSTAKVEGGRYDIEHFPRAGAYEVYYWPEDGGIGEPIEAGEGNDWPTYSCAVEACERHHDEMQMAANRSAKGEK